MIIFHSLLYIISLNVFFGLLEKRNMWLWIVAYWAVLVIKNAVDLFRKPQ